jgi:hypothetical protein
MNQSNETQHGRIEMEPGGQSAGPKCPLVALKLASYPQRPKNSNWNLKVGLIPSDCTDANWNIANGISLSCSLDLES